MKRIWTFGLLLLFILGGCGNDAADEPLNSEGLYQKSCAGCHGGDLQGASGPALKGMADKYSEEELLNLIMKGKGMMPGNLLSEEEAQLVTDWLMEK
jgi:mono/diheme cytochrome c family protein